MRHRNDQSRMSPSPLKVSAYRNATVSAGVRRQTLMTADVGGSVRGSSVARALHPPGHPDGCIKISGAPSPHQSDVNPAPTRPRTRKPQ